MPATSRVATHAGHQVHLTESAGASPLVLFCGGAGVVSDYWDDVTMLLPDVHWATLDRPGLRGTPWPGELPTLTGTVELMAEVVESLGAPAIVVAQSMAGFHAEALARTRPDLVAGVVLVDGTVSFATSPPRDVPLRIARSVHAMGRRRALRVFGGLLHRLGVAALARESALILHRRRFRHRYTDADTLATVIAEFSSYHGQGWDLLGVRSAHPYPPVPTVVLTASAIGGREWLVKQHRLARMLGARQVVSEGGHMLMVDEPETVAEAVRAIAQQVRGG